MSKPVVLLRLRPAALVLLTRPQWLMEPVIDACHDRRLSWLASGSVARRRSGGADSEMVLMLWCTDAVIHSC